MELLQRFPNYNFAEGDCFLWSPKYQTIIYDPTRLETDEGRLALLHEIGHAQLRHRAYRYDLELLNMEIEAWIVAKKLAGLHSVPIDVEHIRQAVNSYDKWLTRRATCPDCNSFGAQAGRDVYHCFTCECRWSVNWRKDRRVKRTVIPRVSQPVMA